MKFALSFGWTAAVNRPLLTCLVAIGFAAGCGDDDGSSALVAGDVSVGADTAPGVDTVADVGAADVPPGGADVAPSPTGSALVETLLDQAVTLTAGSSELLSVEVPDGTVSLTITVAGGGAGYFALADWRGPEGEDLVPAGWTPNEQGVCLTCANRIAFSESVFAAIAPNNPAVTLAAGTHTFSVLATSQPGQPGTIDGEVDVRVHAKVSDDGALPDTGILDLNIHFTGARGWSAATAQDDPEFQQLLASVDSIYAQVGVSLGRVNYIDVDSRFMSIESIQGYGSDLEELFMQSASNSENALNLYLVDEITTGSPLDAIGLLLGVAGGLPGPPLAQGTRKSGVAIVVRDVPGAPAGIDTTMAHEMGHFLGLYHTSENDFFGFLPKVHDPLPDTPEDDQSYLMHNIGSGNILSEYQGRVIRSNPWVRHEQEAP